MMMSTELKQIRCSLGFLRNNSPTCYPGIWSMLSSCDDCIQRLAWVHQSIGLGLVHVVIPTNVQRLALAINKVLQNLGLIVT